jgi:hypothetical protein
MMEQSRERPKRRCEESEKTLLKKSSHENKLQEQSQQCKVKEEVFCPERIKSPTGQNGGVKLEIKSKMESSKPLEDKRAIAKPADVVKLESKSKMESSKSFEDQRNIPKPSYAVKHEIKSEPMESSKPTTNGSEVKVKLEPMESSKPTTNGSEVKVKLEPTEIKPEPMDFSSMEDPICNARPSDTFRQAIKLESRQEGDGKAEKKAEYITNAMSKIRAGFKKLGKTEEMPSQKVIYDLLSKLHKTSVKGDKDTLVRRALKVAKIIGK